MKRTRSLFRHRPSVDRLHAERLEARLPLAVAGVEPAIATAPVPVPLALAPPPAAITITVTPPTGVPQAAAPGPAVYELPSPFQRTTTLVRVLTPASYTPTKTYRTVYVLPVEPGSRTTYGDGLRTVEKSNLHNIHDVIFVAPTFSNMPWYGDHPTKMNLRQESHLLDVVIPSVESRYSVSRNPADRLLLGFSKSGYGAFSMLLRHPDRLGKAVAWDAPLGLAAPRADWGMPRVFGSNANFNAYRVTRLIDQRAADLAGGPARLILAGANTFRGHHARVARQLRERNVPHVFVDGPRFGHSWRSGWLPGAVQLVLA